jgi:hypothetical protein
MLFSVSLRKTRTLHREMSANRSLPWKQQFSEYSLASGWDFTRPDRFCTGFQRSKKSIESPLRRTCYKWWGT